MFTGKASIAEELASLLEDTVKAVEGVEEPLLRLY